MEDNKIKDEELDAIYKYLSININNLTPDELIFWTDLLAEKDPDWSDNTLIT